MSSHRILVTGASGYLGGTLLARWKEANLPAHDKVFALVRTDVQAAAVGQYGAEPLRFDLKDEESVRAAIVDNKITIVYFLVDALYGEGSAHLIKALAQVKKNTGQEVHFLHTSGAKIFSSHAGAPTDKPLLDTDPELYSIQKGQRTSLALLQTAIGTNCNAVEEGEQHGVRTYVFAPCIVYGRGEGFGNQISIQTVAIVKAAQALKRVYKVDEGRPTWPVCHVIDNTTLYLEILRTILNGQDPGHGKRGYFLASPGSIAWDDLYVAMAAGLAKRNVVSDKSVVAATPEIIKSMGEALACPPEYVAFQLGGKCTFTARHGQEIGWKPQFAPEHIIEAADEEVELILANLEQPAAGNDRLNRKK